MFARWATLVALLGLLAGCGVDSAEVGIAKVPAGPGLRAQVRVAGAAPIAPAGFRTQAVVNGYSAVDIDWMKFELWQVQGQTATLLATSQTPTGSGASKTVDWSHLKQNTTYRLKVFAYNAAGTMLNAGATPASQEATTGSSDVMSMAVTVTLANRVFDGKVHPVLSTSNNNASKTDHVSITLQERDQINDWVDVEVGETPAGSGMSKTVDFDHLKMDTEYRLKIRLVRANGITQGSKIVAFTTSNDDFITVNVSI
jgi:hypothetical protein